MRIALVAQHAALAPGETGHADGDEWVRSLGRGLAARGHEVTVYAGKPDASLPDEIELCPGVRIEYDSASPGSGGQADEWRLLDRVPAFCRALRARWRRKRPDVVHALRWTSGLAAVAATHDDGIPVVQRFASIHVPQQRPRSDGSRVTGPERHRAERAIGRSAAAVLAASSAEEAALTRLGVPRRSVHVVPPGVDTAEFTPGGPVTCRNGRTSLLAVTGLAYRGELATLLRAFARIPGAELIVAGGPPRDRLPADRAFRNAVALADSLGVTDRVRFTGEVGDRELPALLRSADLLISVPEHERPGMLCVEAMACGTPVVATPVGVQADAVIDGTTGILVPPGQPVLLAERVRQLLARPMRIEAFSMAAVERARYRYSWERVAEETIMVCDRVRGTATAA